MIRQVRDWWHLTFRTRRRSSYKRLKATPDTQLEINIGSQTRPVPVLPWVSSLPDVAAYRERLLHPDKP